MFCIDFINDGIYFYGGVIVLVMDIVGVVVVWLNYDFDRGICVVMVVMSI